MWTFDQVRLVLSIAVISAAVMGAAVLTLSVLSPELRAEEKAAAEDGADEAANMECAGEPISGSGPGFSSARDASEAAAVEAWTEKATAIFPEASWDTAKDAGISCAVQGLYSKCFAQGIPCRPKTDGADDAAAAPPEE
jgi:hypothetical protein